MGIMPGVLKPLYLKCNTLHAFVYSGTLKVWNTGRTTFEFNIGAKCLPSTKTQSLMLTFMKQHCASFPDHVIICICAIRSTEQKGFSCFPAYNSFPNESMRARPVALQSFSCSELARVKIWTLPSQPALTRFLQLGGSWACANLTRMFQRICMSLLTDINIHSIVITFCHFLFSGACRVLPLWLLSWVNCLADCLHCSSVFGVAHSCSGNRFLLSSICRKVARLRFEKMMSFAELMRLVISSRPRIQTADPLWWIDPHLFLVGVMANSTNKTVIGASFLSHLCSKEKVCGFK